MTTDAWTAKQRAAAFPPHGQAKRRRDELRRYTHSLLASDVGAMQPVMQFPIGLPIPPGWRIVPGQGMNHHHQWSQLIRKE